MVFDNFFARFFGSSREGNYWILALDPNYQTAMVGTPDRRFLWILSRTTQLDDGIYQRLVEQASATRLSGVEPHSYPTALALDDLFHALGLIDGLTTDDESRAAAFILSIRRKRPFLSEDLSS